MPRVTEVIVGEHSAGAVYRCRPQPVNDESVRGKDDASLRRPCKIGLFGEMFEKMCGQIGPETRVIRLNRDS